MPRLTFAIAFIVFAALAGAMSYSAYLVVGVIADQIGTGRILAGLLLGVLFARLPSIRDGKLRTIGLLPKPARRPVMLALIAVCLVSFFKRGEVVPMLFLGFAATFLVVYGSIRRGLINRVTSALFKQPTEPNRPSKADDQVIDVEFREKKD
ncbi:hypothetical protein BH11PSE11_BH11PSE11_30960 [soil metagenome]